VLLSIESKKRTGVRPFWLRHDAGRPRS